MKTILAVLAAVMLTGCFAGVETRSGWHMISLPPSSGKRLAEKCTWASTLKKVKPVDQKLKELGITDADIERAIDKRDEQGNRIK